jgi:hypothetical protein
MTELASELAQLMDRPWLEQCIYGFFRAVSFVVRGSIGQIEGQNGMQEGGYKLGHGDETHNWWDWR